MVALKHKLDLKSLFLVNTITLLCDAWLLIVVKGRTGRVRILVALREPVIGMHTGVDVGEEVRSPLLELLKSIGCSPRAH